MAIGSGLTLRTPNLRDAITLHQQGRIGEATAVYWQILGIEPKNVDALHLLGVIAFQTGQHQVAVDMITKAIELKPDFADAYYNLGNAFKDLKQLAAAVDNYGKAIELKPDFADAYSNRGIALQELKQLEAAVDSYNKAISIRPDYALAYSNRGISLQQLNQLDAAVASYEKAITLNPNYAVAYTNLGNALKDQKRLDAAVVNYEKAIKLKPDFADAYFNLGIALQELKQLDLAIASYDKAIYLKPDFEYLHGVRQHAQMLICDWHNFENNVLNLIKKIQINQKASTCFPVIALPIGLAEQRQVAETWSSDKYPYDPSLGPIIKSRKKMKIRVGYFSADFHNHATSYLLAELFECHDKSEFEVIAFSFGPNANDEMRYRVVHAVDEFIDVKKMSDKDIAQLSRNLEIDIAIDLKGLTQDSRLGIFSYKAAPIQVSYLGYPGTLGTKYIDYIIADETLIPTNSQQHYSEKIVYLPNSYQVNDRQRAISPILFTKQDYGLSQESFVFCCFNNNFKITPDLFDTWIRILKTVEKSVLWLIEDNQKAMENLQKEAQRRGLNKNRLLFSKRIAVAEHLARHKVADLFLDTLPYNAHTTASDALWAGLPVLTCIGESFASRVAASLLFAVGLPEMVTTTLNDYEALAIELSTNPSKLSAIKNKLEKNRLTTPLFDTPRFTKQIELAFKKLNERYLADLPPDHIYIPEWH